MHYLTVPIEHIREIEIGRVGREDLREQGGQNHTTFLRAKQQEKAQPNSRTESRTH